MIVTADTLPAIPVNLRVRSDIRALIDKAASSLGKTRSDFMIDAARRAAEEAILDQTLIRVDSDTYNTFLAAMDTPPTNAGYEKLMTTKTPW